MESKTASKNPRKVIADTLFDRMTSAPCEEIVIERDARNPYAMQVVVDGKKFRVLVKEVSE